MSYDVEHSVDDGIERIVYKPHNPRYETPLLMQHGMWHGAWCWEAWQKTLAELGWESHAHSLPGHGASPVQRSIRWCTLDYYLRFLQAEVTRLPRKPVLLGHSMGGALTQMYLKKVGDDLPAVVLVASWNSHEMQSASAFAVYRDLAGSLLTTLSLTTTPMVRNPAVAADMLLGQNTLYSPETLHNRLDGESMWVLVQYNPLLWHPLKNPATPMLWLIPGADRAVLPGTQQRSAHFYDADIHHIPDAGHNLMMEQNHEALAHQIHDWLIQQQIA